VLESGIRWIFRKATGRDKGGDYCWSPPGARYDHTKDSDIKAPEEPPAEKPGTSPADSSELPPVRRG
jgi:hypothetical protein